VTRKGSVSLVNIERIATPSSCPSICTRLWSRDEEKPGIYKIASAVARDKEQYALYLTRGDGTSPYVYDFSVQEAGSH
jgi:hypothetical protein